MTIVKNSHELWGPYDAEPNLMVTKHQDHTVSMRFSRATAGDLKGTLDIAASEHRHQAMLGKPYWYSGTQDEWAQYNNRRAMRLEAVVAALQAVLK